MDPKASSSDKLANLNKVRLICFGDPGVYPQALAGIVQIIDAGQPVEITRWGADFLAESLASPMPSPEAKQQMALVVLKTIRSYLERTEQDAAVVKSSVQAATSAYPLIFKHTIYNPNDADTWQNMATVKSIILRSMDSWPSGVKACCIKFLQRVVQVQTPGMIADPRRPDNNETSLALVPRDHPLIPPPKLEAEATGLLDRLLSVFHEVHSDAILVTATLNCIGVLVRTRPSIANKILNQILNFNPLRVAGPITPRARVVAKSMERTVRAFLLNLNKRNPSHPLAGRIHGYLDRLQQSRLETLDDSRKRGPPVEPADGLDPAKRQRIGMAINEMPTSPTVAVPLPLPPGPVSIAQLFTLTQDEGTKGFDVTAIPVEILNAIIMPILHSIDMNQLNSAVNAVRARYLHLKAQAQPAPPPIPSAFAEAPDYPESETEDAEQIQNRLDNDVSQLPGPSVDLGPYQLPYPPPMTPHDASILSKDAISRLFGILSAAPIDSQKHTKGLHRTAAAALDRDAWITIVTRLATRPTAGLTATSSDTDLPNTDDPAHRSLPDHIRHLLLEYILADFRRRIDAAISWLNEEWYNDRMCARSTNPQTSSSVTPNFTKWTLRLLDAMLPYVDARDKQLIRLLSEIPALDAAMLDRVKRLAKDPARVALAVNAFHYLALYRPPVRGMCIDALEDLWRNYEDARGLAGKLLRKFRPEVVASADANEPADHAASASAVGGGGGGGGDQVGGDGGSTTQPPEPPDPNPDPSAPPQTSRSASTDVQQVLETAAQVSPAVAEAVT